MLSRHWLLLALRTGQARVQIIVCSLLEVGLAAFDARRLVQHLIEVVLMEPAAAIDVSRMLKAVVIEIPLSATAIANFLRIATLNRIFRISSIVLLEAYLFKLKYQALQETYLLADSLSG